MRKYLLFVILFFLSVTVFSQITTNEDNDRIAAQKPVQKTITDLTASPNPFIEKSRIIFTSTRSQRVLFEVKNVLGKTVFRENYPVKSGKNEILFLRSTLPSGMYFYTIRTNSEVLSKRFVLR